MKKKKQPEQQISLFQETNIVSMEDWKKSQKKKPVLHEKKFGKGLELLFNSLGLVWIHLKSMCLNKFYHTCPRCGHKELVTCHAKINKEYAGYPDYMIVAGAVEAKHRSYGVKTAKFRKGIQEDVCKTLNLKIPVKCINEESEEELIDFLKDMVKKIKGKETLT